MEAASHGFRSAAAKPITWGMTPYAIVCAGGGPRASCGLRDRFPGVPLRYVGPAAGAPYGVHADPSLAVALRAVDAAVTIVVDPAVLLDPAAAAALVAAVEDDTLVAPVLVDDEGRVVSGERDRRRCSARRRACSCGRRRCGFCGRRCRAGRCGAIRARARARCVRRPVRRGANRDATRDCA